MTTLEKEYAEINTAKCFDLWSFCNEAVNAFSPDFLCKEEIDIIGESTVGEDFGKEQLIQMATDIVDYAMLNDEMHYWSFIKFMNERYGY